MSCPHANLVLLAGEKNKLRCRHCHLTIAAAEVADDYCPECYETTGYKRFDFDPVESADSATTRYRCEGCGIIIENA